MHCALFTNEVMDHFLNPRNAGEMADPDGEGCCGDTNCGDYLIICIKVRNKRIFDIRFLVYGCVAAIATSSMTTELAKGKSLEDALKITDEDVVNALGELPENKIHCSLLGPTALKRAIENYYEKIEEYKKCIAYQD